MQNLRNLDIQLLLAFDALMTDPHVTRAARVVGVSQPAMSHILARLRDLFGDPLLVRTTRGMAPTNRAHELIEPVRGALRQLQKVLGTQAAFDPATSSDTFTARMGDVSESLMLPGMLKALEEKAPRISLTLRHLPPPETLKAFDSDEIDFAISTGLSPPKSIRHVDLLEDEMICIMRKGHPAAKRPLTLKVFLALKHVQIAQSIVDEDFAKQHLSRDIVLNIQHWLVAPLVIESTDLVTSVSRRMANLFNARGKLVLRPLPFARQHFHWRLYWHRRYEDHPAHRWIREVVVQACAGLAAPA